MIMQHYQLQHLEQRNSTGGALSVSESSGPGRASGRKIKADGTLSKSKQSALPLSDPKTQITGPGVLPVVESVRCGPAGQMDLKKFKSILG